MPLYNQSPEQQKGQVVAERLRVLQSDKQFVKFLLSTERIHMRRKEDIQTRRTADTSPTALFLKNIRVHGLRAAEFIIAEYEMWAVANGLQVERRTHQ